MLFLHRLLQDQESKIHQRIRDNGGAKGSVPVANVYAFFNPQEQVKSADLETYDNDGNIIPPSERFNSKKSDIRWSTNEDAIIIPSKQEYAIASSAANYNIARGIHQYKNLGFAFTRNVFYIYRITSKKNLGYYFISKITIDDNEDIIKEKIREFRRKAQRYGTEYYDRIVNVIQDSYIGDFSDSIDVEDRPAYDAFIILLSDLFKKPVGRRGGSDSSSIGVGGRNIEADTGRSTNKVSESESPKTYFSDTVSIPEAYEILSKSEQIEAENESIATDLKNWRAIVEKEKTLTVPNDSALREMANEILTRTKMTGNIDNKTRSTRMPRLKRYSGC